MPHSDPPEDTVGNAQAKNPKSEGKAKTPKGWHREAPARLWRAASEKIRHISKDINFWMAAGTWVLAIVSILALRSTDTALERSQRAWIAPILMELQKPLDQGPPVLLHIIYENTGKEPALGIVHAEKGGVYNTPNGWDDWEHMVLPENLTCNALTPVIGESVAYPAAMTARDIEYRISITSHGPEANVAPDQIIKDVINRQRTFYVNGCFAYITSGVTHYSAYCFYLATDKDFPVDKWRFKDCVSGNWAN